MRWIRQSRLSVIGRANQVTSDRAKPAWANSLREAYHATLTEPLPAAFVALLAQLEAQAGTGKCMEPKARESLTGDAGTNH